MFPSTYDYVVNRTEVTSHARLRNISTAANSVCMNKINHYDYKLGIIYLIITTYKDNQLGHYSIISVNTITGVFVFTPDTGSIALSHDTLKYCCAQTEVVAVSVV